MSARLIGSRGSDLALWQSRTVLAALNAKAPPLAWHSDITVITTRGDVDQSPYLAGSVEKEIDGVMKVHEFIRADTLPDRDEMATVSLAKGRQLVDEQGDRLFR